ncbi:MAG: hypothetical protein ACI9F9_003471, partial [Candidatus Paceibacteria bacterium]
MLILIPDATSQDTPQKKNMKILFAASLAALLSASAAAQDQPNILGVWGDDIG